LLRNAAAYLPTELGLLFETSEARAATDRIVARATA
jgi:hypothetical protein